MSLKPFKSFLQEALIDVDKSDVDKIFAPIKMPLKELKAVWDEHYDRFMMVKTKFPSNAGVVAQTISSQMKEVVSKHGPIYGPLRSFDSSVLDSKMCIEAHNVNPIKIHVWLIGKPTMNNAYHVDTHEINICLTYSVFEAMTNSLATVPHYQLPMLRNEVSEIKVKSTIRHELTHWIDDSLHNRYITKALTTAKNHSLSGDVKAANNTLIKMLNHGEKDIYLAPVEITPMVNQIAEYKRRVSQKKWDSMTWKELMIELPSLGSLNDKWGAPWRKTMFTRLARENLIGKNFRKELQ